MEVGGGEERRLGGSCGESFLNEGSENSTDHGVGAAARLTSQKVKPGRFIPLPRRK